MKNKITKKDREESLAEEIKNVQKWFNPKAKVRKVSKIEEDGSITTFYTLEVKGLNKLHNFEGPALVNEKNRKKEYHLNGIQYTKDEFDYIRKSREGLPWYKNPAFKGQTRF